MSYYDNVKDSVENKDDTSKPNFETLRKAAQETSEEDEKEGDDTEIEVLDEGLGSSAQSSGGLDSMDMNKSAGPSAGKQSQSSTGQQRQQTQSSQKQQSRSVQDTSSLEEKLDTIIDQNERMIEILESFGS